MDTLQVQKKCGIVTKIILTISLLLNVLIIGALLFVYIQFKPLIDVFAGQASPVTHQESTSTAQTSQNTGNAAASITPEQEQALRAAGVDPSTVPSSITEAQGDCMIQAVGEERAEAIMGGAQPTFTEIVKASACLK